MTNLDSNTNKTRDDLIEERKNGIIFERMLDDEAVLNAIESITDDNVRTGVIDNSLLVFFRQCRDAQLFFCQKDELSSKDKEKVLDAASILFKELIDRIWCDVFEDDALKQAGEELKQREEDGDAWLDAIG